MRQSCHAVRQGHSSYAWAEKFESFERISSMRETNGNFDSCNSCKRLVPAVFYPVYMSRKFESFERINSIRETNGNFDSCNSCKRLVPSRLHELHESKFPFVSHIEFIRSKFSNFLLMYPMSLWRRPQLAAMMVDVPADSDAGEPLETTPHSTYLCNVTTQAWNCG